MEKLYGDHKKDWTADNWAAKIVVITGIILLLVFGLLVGGCTYWLIRTFGG